MTTSATAYPPGAARADVPAPGLVVLAWRAAPLRLYLVFLLLLVASVAWRKGAYFSGGVDAVVVAKAGLTLLAFVIVLLSRRPAGALATVHGAPLLWLVGYLTVATVGALLTGDALPSFVLAGRLGLLALTILLVVLGDSWQRVLSALAGSMLVLAAFGSLTGLGSLAETGRLYGGLPPLNANEICFLVSVPLLVTFWRCVTTEARWFEYAAVPVLLGVVWLTGARTGLAALLLAMLVTVALTRRVPAFVVGTAALAVPVLTYLAFYTTSVTEFAGRGGLQSILTLNSRTVAWGAALDYHDSLVGRLFGGGLSLKEIPVSARYRSEQILDSSWVSALLQSGYVGTALLLVLVGATLVAAARVPAPYASVVLALVVLVTVVSVLESGLFDTTPAFILFFSLVVLTHRTAAAPVVDPVADPAPVPGAGSGDVPAEQRR